MTGYADMRRRYEGAGLSEAEVAADPLVQFERWFADVTAAGEAEPNAVLLATATPAGAPSARLVLLKAVEGGGFVWYTNRRSRKAAELAANPRAALTFPWHGLRRQVRAEGPVHPVDDATSDAYFASRPRDSQLGAWASPQSEVIADRGALDAALDAATARFAGGAVPRPPHWGGYRLVPDEVEFWQGRPGRLHDRLRYRRRPDGWCIERLAP